MMESLIISYLKKLYFSYNFITFLQPQIFSQLVDLEKLKFTNNSIIKLNENLFHTLNKLEFLEFSNNRLSRLNLNIFVNNLSLEKINVFNNNVLSNVDGSDEFVLDLIIFSSQNYFNIASIKLS